MNNALLSTITRALRITLAAAAGLLFLWALVWVTVVRHYRQAPERPGQIELRVMNWAGGGGQKEEQIVAELIATYCRQHPNIKVTRINPGDAASFFTKLQTMMAADAPPDVFYMGSERLSGFASQDLLLELEPLIAADEAAGRPTLRPADFFRPTVDCFRFDGQATGAGKLYGIPKDFTTIGFYYNKTLFDKAGLPYPPDDWTWDDFITTARELHQRLAGEDVTGAEFMTWPSMIRAYLRTEGLEVSSDDFQHSRLREPDVRAALERLRSWRFDEEGTLTSGKSQVAAGESVFLSGKVGMAGPFGRWVVPTYRPIKEFEWDFAPLPHGKVKANVAFTVSWSIAKQTRYPQEAWELVKFLCGADGQAQAAGLGLAIPTLKAVARSTAFMDPNQKPERDYVYVDQAEYAEVLRWPADTQFESRLGNRLEAALRTGSTSLENAITQLEDEWRKSQQTPLRRTDFPAAPWGRITRGLVIPLAGLLLVALVVWWQRRPKKIGLREELAGYGFVSPWVLGFLAFMAFPIVLSFLLSCMKWTGVSGLQYAQWVGLANYRELLFYDDKFRMSLRVTAYYALFAVPLGQLLALLGALLLNHDLKLSGFFRSAWYLPSVLAGVGVAILWKWVFDGDHGLLNTYLLGPLLEPFRVKPPQWFDKDAATFGPPAYALMSLWGIGGTMVIYLAGLKGIPTELYEAASIDGASRWSRLRNVTLPMLSPVMFFNVIMAIIGSFQVFTQAYVMTGGGPGDDTRFYVLYLFNQAFEFHEMGYASALAWLLLAIILILTLIVMRGSRRFVYYEALK